MADTIPVAQLRAFVERIERIEADIKDLNGDKSEVYKELRGCGFDVKAVRAVVAKRKLDTADREERDAMFDLYWSALNGTGTEDATRVHVHEGQSYADQKGRGGNHLDPSVSKASSAETGEKEITSFDPETGELTDNQESEANPARSSAYVGTAPDENPTQDDAVAPTSSTNSTISGGNGPAAAGSATDEASTSYAPAINSHSQEILPPADTAGGVVPPAPPATLSDDEPFQPPAFLERDYSDPGPIPDFMRRTAH